MRPLNLKSKIIIPMVVIFAIMSFALAGYSSIQHAKHIEEVFYERITVTSNILKRYLENCAYASKIAAVSVSRNEKMIRAIKKRDTAEIIKILTVTREPHDVDHYIITDTAGIVLARTFSNIIGDSAANQQSIKDALEGKVSTYFEEGVVVKVSIRTGSPIYDMDGTLIGAISAAVRLDTNKAVDELKNYFDAEFTVYHGNKRVATTITSNGERIAGTPIDPMVAKILFEDKKEYLGKVNIAGENYSTFYMPLLNATNDVFAIIATGKPNNKLIEKENTIMIKELIAGSVGIAILVIILSIIIVKITKPMDQLKFLVSEVARGNLSVDIDRHNVSKDEMGELILGVYSFIDVIKSMTKDLSDLSYELKTSKNPNLRIDTSKYSGSYKEIVEGIQSLTNSIITMNEIMTIMESMDSMVSVIDLDYNIVYINSNMLKLYGISLNECKGKKCYKAIRNLDQPCSICQMPILLQNKETLPTHHFEYIHDDLMNQWISGRSSIIRWIDGSMVYFQSLNDETDKKINQEQLNNALQTAEKALTAKSVFLANMSHEIRTPLNVIIGLSDLELENNNVSDVSRKNLRMISVAGTTLLRIVNDILDISKIESGHFALIQTEYHLASLLNDTVTLNVSRIGVKQITFHLNIREDLPSKLYGDDLRIKQILNNLLSNAIKYTSAGSIELCVRCKREGENDVWMVIIVKDTGVGIRPEDLKNLFTDYNQIDAKANRNVEGTGLGLSITKKLVESMDGTIFVESEHEKGTTFRVRIRQGFVTDNPIGPLVVKNLCNFHYNENKLCSANKLIRNDLSHAKVLVVDDSQLNLEVAKGLLQKYKMQVDCVTSGQAAIERIKLGEPVYDAIFMDHMMPKMDGIEAADKIRALGTNYAQTIPIIALTANAIVGTEEMFYEHNFQAFITKPIDIKRLDSVIEQWIKK